MKKKTVSAVLQTVICVVLLGAVVFFVAIGRAVLAIDQCRQQQSDAAAQSLQKEAPCPKLSFGEETVTLSPCGADVTENITDLLPDTFFYQLLLQWKPSLSLVGIAADMDCPLQEYTLEQPAWQLTVPEGFTAYLSLTDENGQLVTDEQVNGLFSGSFTQNGLQNGLLTLRTETASFDYVFRLSMNIVPQVTVDGQQCKQGDVVPVTVTGNLTGLPMTVSSELGLCDFVPLSQVGSYAAYLPVAYNCSPGEWNIDVTVGEQAFDFTLTVEEREFTVQYMTIDQQIADSTMNSQAATEEYRSTVYPFYQYTDNKRLWDGLFIEPVSGYRISTEYGLWRYVNGKYSERHSGVDMACALGTPVFAPQNGEVLFAGYLQLSGNTVILSHGGGVKSMFFHMNSLNVQTGDTVSTGEKLGEVGTTGYSTGPHLHYEVKIGSASIDPMALFDGTSKLYSGVL